MRINNVGNKNLMFDDLNRGLGHVHKLHVKAPIYVKPGEYIDVLDSDKTAMSLDQGSLKTYKDSGDITTQYSMMGIKSGSFVVVESENDTFTVNNQDVELDEGLTSMEDVVEAINSSASGVSAALSQKPEEGFLVLFSDDVINIGEGNANSSLGFFQNQKTLLK